MSNSVMRCEACNQMYPIGTFKWIYVWRQGKQNQEMLCYNCFVKRRTGQMPPLVKTKKAQRCAVVLREEENAE